MFVDKSESSKLKMIDFGLSTRFGKAFKSMQTLVGTPYFVAPEVLEGQYTEKCDM
jgi:calcium-dependent protein kinase